MLSQLSRSAGYHGRNRARARPDAVELPSGPAALEDASMDPSVRRAAGRAQCSRYERERDVLASALALAVGFYGVHRAMRTGLTKALVVAPAAIWALGNAWRVVPDRLTQTVLSEPSILVQTSMNLATTVFLVALLAMAIAARRRLGAGLSTATCVALAIGLVFRLVPSTRLENAPGTFALLALATESGWLAVAAHWSGLCMFLVGVGPLAVQPLPRRRGAIAGAGACAAERHAGSAPGSPAQRRGDSASFPPLATFRDRPLAGRG